GQGGREVLHGGGEDRKLRRREAARRHLRQRTRRHSPRLRGVAQVVRDGPGPGLPDRRAFAALLKDVVTTWHRRVRGSRVEWLHEDPTCSSGRHRVARGLRRGSPRTWPRRLCRAAATRGRRAPIVWLLLPRRAVLAPWPALGERRRRSERSGGWRCRL